MEQDIKLTKLAKCAGCGAKVGAGTLSKILQDLPVHQDPRLLVGYDTNDDASVYQIEKDLCVVQTLDFFPPIVDDPRTFGQIAAANAMSDIFAMGAEPKLAMNILCASTKMDKEHIQELLRGGYEKVYEAGAVITGGHTILGEEPKYGLSVTGFAHPDKILKNSGAREGDVLILTKALGIGILTTAAKGGMAEQAALGQAVEQMCALNKRARDIMVDYPIHGCTDVTGFGLLGHAYEMAQGSGVTIHIEYDKVPQLQGILELAEMGILPEGMYRNRAFAEKGVGSYISQAEEDILYDPQTSGGLMIAVSERVGGELLARLQDALPHAAAIGYATKKEEFSIVVK